VFDFSKEGDTFHKENTIQMTLMCYRRSPLSPKLASPTGLSAMVMVLGPCCTFFFFFVFLLFLWAAPAAYGGSQARGLIGAAATSLRQSHSNAGPESSLQPTPQLTATLDP